MLRNWLMLILLCGFVMPAQASGIGRDPYTYFFDQSLGDFTEELAIAKEEGKQGIFLFFEMDECPFCHVMKNTVLNKPGVQKYFKEHFRSYAVDIEGDIEITDFEGNVMRQKDFATKKNRVRATPVLAFYDLEGKQVIKYIGKTSSLEEFMLLGKFMAEGHYKTTNFMKYKRQQQGKL